MTTARANLVIVVALLAGCGENRALEHRRQAIDWADAGYDCTLEFPCDAFCADPVYGGCCDNAPDGGPPPPSPEDCEQQAIATCGMPCEGHDPSPHTEADIAAGVRRPFARPGLLVTKTHAELTSDDLLRLQDVVDSWDPHLFFESTHPAVGGEVRYLDLSGHVPDCADRVQLYFGVVEIPGGSQIRIDAVGGGTINMPIIAGPPLTLPVDVGSPPTAIPPPTNPPPLPAQNEGAWTAEIALGPTRELLLQTTGDGGYGFLVNSYHWLSDDPTCAEVHKIAPHTAMVSVKDFRVYAYTGTDSFFNDLYRFGGVYCANDVEPVGGDCPGGGNLYMVMERDSVLEIKSSTVDPYTDLSPYFFQGRADTNGDGTIDERDEIRGTFLGNPSDCDTNPDCVDQLTVSDLTNNGIQAVKILTIDTFLDPQEADMVPPTQYLHPGGFSDGNPGGGIANPILCPEDAAFSGSNPGDVCAPWPELTGSSVYHGSWVQAMNYAALNGVAFSGVAYNTTRLALGFDFSLEGAGSLGGIDDVLVKVSTLVRALDSYSAAAEPHVITMSFGAPIGHESLRFAIQDVYDRGTVMFAAAGNEGLQEKPLFPGALPQVNAAMSNGTLVFQGGGLSSINFDTKSQFFSLENPGQLTSRTSNEGGWMSAPGIGLFPIFRTLDGDDCEAPGVCLIPQNGTSFSTQILGGSFAVALSDIAEGGAYREDGSPGGDLYPSLQPLFSADCCDAAGCDLACTANRKLLRDNVLQAMEGSATEIGTQIGFDDDTGHGAINHRGVVEFLRDTERPPAAGLEDLFYVAQENITEGSPGQCAPGADCNVIALAEEAFSGNATTGLTVGVGGKVGSCDWAWAFWLGSFVLPGLLDYLAFYIGEFAAVVLGEGLGWILAHAPQKIELKDPTVTWTVADLEHDFQFDADSDLVTVNATYQQSATISVRAWIWEPDDCLYPWSSPSKVTLTGTYAPIPGEGVTDVTMTYQLKDEYELINREISRPPKRYDLDLDVSGPDLFGIAMIFKDNLEGLEQILRGAIEPGLDEDVVLGTTKILNASLAQERVKPFHHFLWRLRPDADAFSNPLVHHLSTHPAREYEHDTVGAPLFSLSRMKQHISELKDPSIGPRYTAPFPSAAVPDFVGIDDDSIMQWSKAVMDWQLNTLDLPGHEVFDFASYETETSTINQWDATVRLDDVRTTARPTIEFFDNVIDGHYGRVEMDFSADWFACVIGDPNALPGGYPEDIQALRRPMCDDGSGNNTVSPVFYQSNNNELRFHVTFWLDVKDIFRAAHESELGLAPPQFEHRIQVDWQATEIEVSLVDDNGDDQSPIFSANDKNADIDNHAPDPSAPTWPSTTMGGFTEEQMVTFFRFTHVPRVTRALNTMSFSRFEPHAMLGDLWGTLANLAGFVNTYIAPFEIDVDDDTAFYMSSNLSYQGIFVTSADGWDLNLGDFPTRHSSAPHQRIDNGSGSAATILRQIDFQGTAPPPAELSEPPTPPDHMVEVDVVYDVSPFGYQDCSVTPCAPINGLTRWMAWSRSLYLAGGVERSISMDGRFLTTYGASAERDRCVTVDELVAYEMIERRADEPGYGDGTWIEDVQFDPAYECLIWTPRRTDRTAPDVRADCPEPAQGQVRNPSCDFSPYPGHWKYDHRFEKVNRPRQFTSLVVSDQCLVELEEQFNHFRYAEGSCEQCTEDTDCKFTNPQTACGSAGAEPACIGGVCQYQPEPDTDPHDWRCCHDESISLSERVENPRWYYSEDAGHYRFTPTRTPRDTYGDECPEDRGVWDPDIPEGGIARRLGLPADAEYPIFDEGPF